MKFRFFILCVICSVFANGCMDQETVYSYEEVPTTFHFYGNSNHFSFQTGEATYDGNKRNLVIKDFKVKNDLLDHAFFKVQVFFHQKRFGFFEVSSKQDLEKLTIGESGQVYYDENGIMYGEIDSFIETDVNHFKDDLHVEITYCQNSSCETEFFQIDYLEANSFS